MSAGTLQGGKAQIVDFKKNAAKICKVLYAVMSVLAWRLSNLQVHWPRKPSKRSCDRPVGKAAMEIKQKNRTKNHASVTGQQLPKKLQEAEATYTGGRAGSGFP